MVTKLTIEVDYTLAELKAAYRNYYGYPIAKKVTKADVANWLGNLAEADIIDDIEKVRVKDEER